jgi:dipeptidyl-peptidase-3
MIAKWVYEQGRKDNVIEKVKKDGKSYFVVRDYNKLRELFGQLLREVQRIKSQGDYEAGKKLMEDYGVKIDYELHKEIRERFAKLNTAPYSGFVYPTLEAIEKDGEIVDVKLNYNFDFKAQMLKYAKEYSFLPTYN